MHDDLGARDREIETLKGTVGAQQEVIEEKDQKADLYGRLASNYQDRTEKAESEMERLRLISEARIEPPAAIAIYF